MDIFNSRFWKEWIIDSHQTTIFSSDDTKHSSRQRKELTLGNYYLCCKPKLQPTQQECLPIFQLSQQRKVPSQSQQPTNAKKLPLGAFWRKQMWNKGKYTHLGELQPPVLTFDPSLFPIFTEAPYLPHLQNHLDISSKSLALNYCFYPVHFVAWLGLAG